MAVPQCCAAGAPTRRRRRPRMSLAVSETPLRAISREEVARHASAESLWAIIDGRVYDLTRFAKVAARAVTRGRAGSSSRGVPGAMRCAAIWVRERRR